MTAQFIKDIAKDLGYTISIKKAERLAKLDCSEWSAIQWMKNLQL